MCLFTQLRSHFRKERRKKTNFTYFTAIHLICIWRWKKFDPSFGIHMQIWSRTNIFAYILFIRNFSIPSVFVFSSFFFSSHFQVFWISNTRSYSNVFSFVRLQIFAYKAKVYNNTMFFPWEFYFIDIIFRDERIIIEIDKRNLLHKYMYWYQSCSMYSYSLTTRQQQFGICTIKVRFVCVIQHINK